VSLTWCTWHSWIPLVSSIFDCMWRYSWSRGYSKTRVWWRLNDSPEINPQSAFSKAGLLSRSHCAIPDWTEAIKCSCKLNRRIFLWWCLGVIGKCSIFFVQIQKVAKQRSVHPKGGNKSVVGHFIDLAELSVLSNIWTGTWSLQLAVSRTWLVKKW